MASKNQKILAIVVIVMVIIGATVIVVLNQEPKTSEARAMILTADDVQASDGGYWYQTMIYEDQSLPTTLSEARSEFKNDSMFYVNVHLGVFENETRAHTKLLNATSTYFNATSTKIGDESYSGWGGHAIVVFREKTIFVWISVDAYPTNVTQKTWLEESCLHYAELQLSKIDQYLAQHPGAS